MDHDSYEVVGLGEGLTSTAIRRIVPVCAVWLSGSYLTSKANPNDIDVLLVVRAEDLEALDPGVRPLFTDTGLHAVATKLNVRVDAYLLGWRQLISPDPGHNPDHSFYYVMRGYWDDWWMRLRNQAGAGQPIDLEALPRRGYVEVILDGYRP